jgi:hypothetical protein
MKKTFPLIIPNNAPARIVDAIKSELRKYLKRERKKNLPEEYDFWDFDCRIGPNAEEATQLHVAELNEGIDHASANDWGTVYVEILAKAAKRAKVSKD